MCDWEFDDDMIDLWLFIMYIMIIILEVQEEVPLGKDWRSIQHSHHWIWEWGVDNVWFGFSWWFDWFLIIYDEYNVNKIGDSGGSGIGEVLKFNSTLKTLDLHIRSW